MKSILSVFGCALGLLQGSVFGQMAAVDWGKEIPSFACSDAVAFANLNLNGQGNVLTAAPGERIFGIINFSCDTECMDLYQLNQIVIGYEGVGPMKCIFNELGYRCGGDRIASFFLEAPKTPGVYDIQCSLEQERSPLDAIQNWNKSHQVKMTVGRIVVN